jgi:ribosomal small subunit protein bTHX
VGKGDRRTQRGKIWRGSHGKTRSRDDEKARARKRHGPKPSQLQQKNQES